MSNTNISEDKGFSTGHKKKPDDKLCEVCHERKTVVQCQYCHKHLCSKCYGSWAEARACCGREDEIFQKTQKAAATA